MTERLYYQNSHMRDFSAKVISCEPRGGEYAVILSRTAFFPEGGGQAADTGNIAGAQVIDVREEGDEIVHVTASPVDVGTRVRCAIAWDTRFHRMQNHSGEHIVSGIVHKLYGYDNVGFHMGADSVTLDFNGELNDGDLKKVESIANMTVWRNLPVTASYPSAEELSIMEYRSKKELSGSVRIVSIEGVDHCACCAPHVSHTGEIGIIKLLSAERHRGGMRLVMVCGADALLDYNLRCENIAAISELLSAKQLETAAAVRRIFAEAEREKRRADATELELARRRAAALLPTDGNICLFEGELSEPALRELVNLGMKKSRLCAAFSGVDGAWRYIIGSDTLKLRAVSREINAAIDGRGGGSDAMLQGTAKAERATIEEYFRNARL
ncbi:MAG: alanyl-tRNA editing protein [Oscillospiraceae bacterium]